MNKTIKYVLFVLAFAAVVLLFVLPCVVLTPVIGDSVGYTLTECLDTWETDSALSTFITAIITTCLVGLAIIVAVCDDLKVAKLSNVAKLLGILGVLAGIACMVSCIVLTCELNDNTVMTALYDTIAIGFGSFGALIAGIFCGVPILLLSDKKAKKSKKKTTKKKARK